MIERLTHSGMCWELRAEFREALEREVLPRFSSFPELSGCSVFKTTYGRRTIYVMDPGPAGLPPLFIKVYTSPRPMKQIKYLVRHSRTRQEWEMGLFFTAQGLPCALSLGMGEIRKHGLLFGEALIQEYLVGYEPFDAYLKRLRQHTQSSAFRVHQAVEQFARQVRVLHEKGVVQRDFKPENVMVKQREADLDFRFVDLERAQRWPTGLSKARRTANLGKLLQAFEHVGTMIDRRRFLRAYLEGDVCASAEKNKMCRKAARRAEIIARKRAREVRVWPVHTNQLYLQFTHGPWIVYMRRYVPRAELEGWLELGEGHLVESFSATYMPEDTTITLVPRICQPRWRGFSRGFCGGALYALRNIHSLENRGFRWVQTIAAVEHRAAGPMRKGYLLVRDFGERFRPLTVAWSLLDHAARERFAWALGRYVRLLQQRGFIPEKAWEEIIVSDATREIAESFTLDHLERIILLSPSPRANDPAALWCLARALNMNEEHRALLFRGFAPYLRKRGSPMA